MGTQRYCRMVFGLPPVFVLLPPRIAARRGVSVKLRYRHRSHTAPGRAMGRGDLGGGRPPVKPEVMAARSGSGRSASGEREREQARAQQHEAGRRQCEESVGHEVMITHDTPATLDAGPNSLKISESAFLKEVCVVSAGVQALERKPSNAWARKMPALTRPKNAVTVSIIANFLPPRLERTTAGAHSQKDLMAGIEDRAD